MDQISISDVRHDGETWSRVLLMMIAVTGLAILVVSVIGAIWLAVFVVLEIFFHHLAMAFFRANSVKVTNEQFPEIYRMVDLYSTKLGLKKVPEVYIIQQTILNAFATRVARRNVIVVYSHTVETMLEEESRDALGMVLAHEIGHLAANHLRWAAVIGSTSLFAPPLYLYWSRCCEYTADRLAYLCVENKDGSFEGLLKMTVGKKLAPATNVHAFVKQYESLKKDWMARLSEFFSTHPHLVNRYFRLRDFAERQHRNTRAKSGEVCA